MFPPAGVLNQQPQGYPSLLTSLRAWYTLEEASGNRVDAHGNAAPFDTVWGGSGDPDNRTGLKGNAVNFSGTHNARYIHRDTAGASQLDFTSTAFSLSFWLYMDIYAATTEFWFTRRSSTSNGYGFYTLNGASFGALFHVRANTAKLYTGLAAGGWYHFYCWWNGTNTMGIRMNDSSQATTTESTGPNLSYSHFFMGASHVNGNKADGAIDELGLWARNLTAEEITWLYNAGAGRTYADL